MLKQSLILPKELDTRSIYTCFLMNSCRRPAALDCKPMFIFLSCSLKMDKSVFRAVTPDQAVGASQFVGSNQVSPPGLSRSGLVELQGYIFAAALAVPAKKI